MISWMDPRSLGASAEHGQDDRFARMTPEERLEVFVQLCELTDSIIRHRPDAERLRSPTPRSPESEALWQRLIAGKQREHVRRRR
jgi:hypothetical protein